MSGLRDAFGLPPAVRSIVLRIQGRAELQVLVYRDATRLRAACNAVARASAQRPLGAVFPADYGEKFAVMLLCQTHLTAEIIAHECLHVVAIYARKLGWNIRNPRQEEYMAVILGHLVATLQSAVRRRNSGGKFRK